MLESIRPGLPVTVTVVKQPRSAAAAKTLTRVLNKDPHNKAEDKRLTKDRKRNTERRQRGGRLWAVRLVKQHPACGRIGETGTVVATTDVLRDLRKIGRASCRERG